jgi:hypothetical protein
MVFHLSQNYPKTLGPDTQPWRAFDPTRQRSEYLYSALGYFFQGNLNSNAEMSFDPAKNPVRQWYHAPWQDFGINGREFVHGLTRERTSEPGDLHSSQTHYWHNYAIGFYNAPGGYVIGRVWADHGMPDSSQASFPEGTVAAKLLFTTASVAEVPYLRGSPEWTGYVYANPNTLRPNLGDPRALMKLRLLQIDIAVKDSRVAATTGWVFGTFVYGGGLTGKPGQGWANVQPVGLMWGNDPTYSGSGPLTETVLNPQVLLPHYGWQGRLNGPVDNRASSCLSCHSTAQDPQAKMMPLAGDDPRHWFRNIRSGQPFDPGARSLDYSLQLSTGIANFREAQKLASQSTLRDRITRYNQIKSLDPRPPRDGGLTH